MSFSLRLLVRGSCLFLPSPRGDGLYALLCPRGAGSGARLRFNIGDLAEGNPRRPSNWPDRKSGAGFWPLAGADLALAAPSAAVGTRPPTLESDLAADLASVGLGLRCLAPRLGGAASLAAAGLSARLRLPWGTLGAWSSGRWQRLRAGRLFRGDAAGGCAFLLAEIDADALAVEDLERGITLRLVPSAGRLLELEIEPAEALPTCRIREEELAGVG